MAGLPVPLPTLRPCPRGHARTARGRYGSLRLHRDGLAPSPPRRSPGALPIVISSDTLPIVAGLWIGPTSGAAMKLFQASQQASTIWVVGFIEAVGELVAPQIGPYVLDRVEFGRVGRQREQADVAGDDRDSSLMCQPAPSTTRIAWAPGDTASEISARCRFMASVSARGMTSPAPTARAGHRRRRTGRPICSACPARRAAVSRDRAHR